jgi:hypothetical protein
MTSIHPEYSRSMRLCGAADTSVQYVVTTMPREEAWHERVVVRRYVHGDVASVLARLRRVGRERDVRVDVYWGPPRSRRYAAWAGSYIARARGEVAR